MIKILKKKKKIEKTIGGEGAEGGGRKGKGREGKGKRERWGGEGKFVVSFV